LRDIVPPLIQKGEMPDGSIFDTLWRIFMHHMAHFYAPRGSLRVWRPKDEGSAIRANLVFDILLPPGKHIEAKEIKGFCCIFQLL